MAQRDYERTYEGQYEYGNAVRDYGYRQRQYEPETERRQAHRPRRKTSFSVLGFAVAGIAFVIFGIAVVNYVQLQSELTGKVKSVASKQIKLTNLQSENDEHYARVTSSVDLKHIEEVARGELGMTYAGDGQVVVYTSVGNDYMRKTDGN